MKRLVASFMALSLLLAACTVQVGPSADDTISTPSTTTTVIIEDTSENYPEALVCPGDGTVDALERQQLVRDLNKLIDEVNDELVLTRVLLGTFYVPGQYTINKENYFPLSFSDFIDCKHTVVVFTVAVLGGVDNSDFTVTSERWARAIYEISIRIRADERFDSIEKIGVRTIWVADSSFMDGVMDMSEIKKVSDTAFAGIYAQILLNNNWTMDVHRRYPKK